MPGLANGWASDVRSRKIKGDSGGSAATFVLLIDTAGSSRAPGLQATWLVQWAEAGCTVLDVIAHHNKVQKDWPRAEGSSMFHLSWNFFSFQGYEDWLRHKADNAMNQCPVHFIQHGKLVRKQSRKLRVSNN